MDLISTRDAASKWDITQRRVIVLCSEGRIPDAQIVGNSWVIPSEAKKPIDAITKDAKNSLDIAKPFLKWAGGKG